MKARILSVASLLLALVSTSAAPDDRAKAPATPANGTQVLPTTTKPLTPPGSGSAAGQGVSAFASGWTRQVERLALAGISEDVLISYVDSAGMFNLSAEEIIKLTQAGVPQSVLSAMLQHDSEILAGTRQVLTTTVPEPNATVFSFKAPAKPSAPSVSALPDPVVAQQDLETVPEPEEPATYWPEYAYSPTLQTESVEISPVRKPYAEQLTDPIIIYRGYVRPSNVQFLHSFP